MSLQLRAKWRRSFPTEARSVGAPKFIRVNTEARSEIRQTASGAPADAR